MAQVAAIGITSCACRVAQRWMSACQFESTDVVYDGRGSRSVQRNGLPAYMQRKARARA